MQVITGAEGSFEEFLVKKASYLKSPLGANLELIPVCNMDCRMCYVRTDMAEVNRLGGLPDTEMWLQLGREMRDMGTLFVLLTGGEPLMHPHFKEIYHYYYELGFILTVNTNGTLINEDWADFFAEYPPRRLNITIYGPDNETYDRLCCNPKGFDQLSHAIHLLQERQIDIRFSCSLTNNNYAQWDDMRRVASEWKIPMVSAYYMMPPGRKITHSGEGVESDGAFTQNLGQKHTSSLQQKHDSSRLAPELAAQAAWRILTEQMSEDEKQEYTTAKLQQVNEFTPDRPYRPGYLCNAGSAGFWVKWDGSFTACGMMGDTEFNIRKTSFAELWEKLKKRTAATCLSEACHTCKYQAICPHCAASEYTENGTFGKEPEYLCRFARSLYRILKENKK